MKLWKCKDGVVFINKALAVSYSLDYGLASNGGQAVRDLVEVTVTNASRFAPMGTYEGWLIFRLLEN
jgi:hypothetical protein